MSIARWPSNFLGPCLPMGNTEEICSYLGILPKHLVLEVGGAGNPFGRANVVCDLTFGSCAQRNGAPATFRDDVTYVEAAVESLPFRDNEFDFVYCTQVLEHVVDPVLACRELARVARSGFVEVPSRFGELCNGNPSHRWIIDRDAEGVLRFHPRPFIEHPLRNFFYGVIFQSPKIRDLERGQLRNLFNHQVTFSGSLPCHVVRPASGAPVFNYEDPQHAFRAHLDFASSTLEAGAPPEYGFPEALEAVRLAPTSNRARIVLATYQAKLGSFVDAERSLDGIVGETADGLRSLCSAARAGHLVDLASVKLDSNVLNPLKETVTVQERPLVSFLIAGASRAESRSVVEAALAQDYPRVEVLLASASPADYAGLRMGERFQVVPEAHGLPVPAALNRLAIASKGDLLAFSTSGDVPMSHHVERLVAHLGASSADGVHGDRVLMDGTGVVGPDIRANNPASAGIPLSNFVLRRDFVLRVGAINEDGESSMVSWIQRAAESGRIHHVREVTVKSPRPSRSGEGSLELVEATRRLRPLELLRELMGAHSRELALRSRVQDLERRLQERESVTGGGEPRT